LHDILKNSIELLTPRVQQKGLVLNYSIPKEIPAGLVGDPSRLRQILLNLIGNATKFTDRGEIALEVAQTGEIDGEIQLRFSVRDSGIGITEDAQKNLFQSFTQADTSTTRRFGGTGLGLAICRKLVELMGGTIGVSSTPGKGSTFWFTLPFARQKAMELPVNRATIALKYLNNILVASLPAVPNNTRIILAEDNKINQLVGSRQLKKLGYNNVHIAGTGIEAIEAWRQDKDCIILMDCQMPEMDGYEATGKIRELEMEGNLPRTLIIAMTAEAIQGDRKRCLMAGMDDYVPKPVDIDELRNALKKADVDSEQQNEEKTAETIVEESSPGMVHVG
jgi:CheY-like chemotaxis protein